jgi:phosphoribosylamine--glycine ligase
MKVLVIGSGGREHALCWKIAQSPKVTKVICAPGNAGIAQVATCFPDVKADDINALLKLARYEKADLTVVGPEVPLTLGIVDKFELEKLRIFGPSLRGAKLEGSKVFCKDLMRKYGIPTADYQSFEDPERALAYLENIGAPVVIKADGLAAGKGVIVAKTLVDARAAITDMMKNRRFGDAGSRIIIEEMLEGEEASILALTDGSTIIPLESSQDHKAAFDGDTGPNTGGMGAYSPAPVVTPEVEDRIIEDILVQIVHALNKEEINYRGLLYAGIMVTKTGPKALEFNVRFGDPECQPIMQRLDCDLVPLLEGCIDGTLDQQEIRWKAGASVCVVLASGGYPDEYEKGKRIRGIEDADAVEGVKVFHGGTALNATGQLVTSGGRVLGVTATGSDIDEAIRRAYEGVSKISWDGMQYRTDIGAKASRRSK